MICYPITGVTMADVLISEASGYSLLNKPITSPDFKATDWVGMSVDCRAAEASTLGCEHCDEIDLSNARKLAADDQSREHLLIMQRSALVNLHELAIEPDSPPHLSMAAEDVAKARSHFEIIEIMGSALTVLDDEDEGGAE